MSTNPRPQKIIAVLDGQGSIMQADVCRPEWADSPKVKRGVPGIVPQECEASISLAPDGLGEPTIADQKRGVARWFTSRCSAPHASRRGLLEPGRPGALPGHPRQTPGPRLRHRMWQTRLETPTGRRS